MAGERHAVPRVERIVNATWRTANKQAGEIERIVLEEFQFSGITRTLLALIRKSFVFNGAGEGNRTLVTPILCKQLWQCHLRMILVKCRSSSPDLTRCPETPTSPKLRQLTISHHFHTESRRALHSPFAPLLA